MKHIQKDSIVETEFNRVSFNALLKKDALKFIINGENIKLNKNPLEGTSVSCSQISNIGVPI